MMVHIKFPIKFKASLCNFLNIQIILSQQCSIVSVSLHFILHFGVRSINSEILDIILSKQCFNIYTFEHSTYFVDPGPELQCLLKVKEELSIDFSG